MHSNDYEEAFGNYLESREYEQNANLLFAVARNAFEAGWLAAGGTAPQPQKIFEVVRNSADGNVTIIET